MGSEAALLPLPPTRAAVTASIMPSSDRYATLSLVMYWLIS
jgi:hypothetical protein